MAEKSSTYIVLTETGSELHFSAVTQIRHSLSLKVATDTDPTEATDYLNGARKQPAKVVVSILETDTGRLAGWAIRLAQNLEAIRVSRALLQVVTPLKIYNNMVLSDLVILQEEGKPNSWTGTLSFTEVEPNNGSEKTSDNSSAVTDTGTAVTQTVASGSNSSSSASGSSSVSGSGSSSGSSSGGIIYDSPLRQLLQKAGIELTN